MIRALSFRGVVLGLGLLATVCTGSAEETIRLRRGLVVPIRFESDLSMRESRVEDRFFAAVEDSRDLPKGTRLHGVVLEIQPARGDRPAFMDLEFDALVLPDGRRQRIQAVPIRMDDKSIRRGGDGRFTAKRKLEDSKKHVVGGMIGGYLLGRILGDKGSEGIMLGALAGIILAESERNGSAANDVVIKRDASMGALFERDAQFEWDERSEAANGRPVRFEYEGREIRFEADSTPYRDEETWMIPLESTAAQLGLKVEMSGGRRIFVEDDEIALILEHDSKNYRLNGKKGTLSKDVIRRNGIVYVPLDALLAARIGHWSINGTRIEN